MDHVLETWKSKPARTSLAAADARPLNALTIDVEDYFQVSAFESIIDRSRWDRFPSRVEWTTGLILDELERAGIHATFFILGWVAKQHPRLVRRIHDDGHEIACHSYWHRLVYELTPSEFRADLRQAREVLEDQTGVAIRAYRAPSFSITQRSLWALDVLIEEGFTHDSSIYPTYHDRYGIAGSPTVPHVIQREAGSLIEFPMPVTRPLGLPLPVGGGGYFRLYPYWLTRCALTGLNAGGQPFVVYLHPWEFDPDQPRLRVGLTKRFRHYVGLKHTRGKFLRLLKDFRFGTLTEALAGRIELDTPVRLAA